MLETGKPIVSRVYGFVANRSTALNCVTIRPVIGLDGTRIGTATVYHRAEKDGAATNWYEPIRKAITYLNAHIAENVPVKTLAEMSNYSVVQFGKLFARLTQMTPAQYVISLRINKAKTLLRTTDGRVTDIAHETGFCDHSHFIKTFRRLTGLTPKEFRRTALD